MDKRSKVQAEAVQAIKDNSWIGLVDISPRVGKTLVGLEAIRGKEDKSIGVIFPYNSIKDSWLSEIDKWNLGFTPILLNQRSLEELPSNLDLLISDETQTLSDNQIQIIKAKKPKRLLGLSGTLSSKTLQKLRQELNLKVIYRYSIEQAIADGIISDYEIFIKEIDITKEERKKYNELTKNFEYYKQLSFANPKLSRMKDMAALKRAQYVYRMPSKLKAAKEIIDDLERCLVFTTLTDVANKLCDHSFHSKSNPYNLELFQKERIDKLSTVGMLSMGFTAKSLKHAVIHQIQSNEELQIQKILRTCNLEGEKKAQIYITVAKDTQDVVWLSSALQSINQSRVKYI